ncbi:hypothetical protein Dsin_010130 [Dipteronia sinensis]|uniref:Pyrrolo-quinoline quinone repeat domain-containing protein n=1 Tax=Dipteronia sinensis TaxID=43782 RepID=A0AAE0EE48_9ROSI|nr:hypothetical protein Dsin_010130 [Dipteronia sinensis]
MAFWSFPCTSNGVVYFPSWNGYLYAVNAINGALIWKQNLSDLTGLKGTGIVANVNVTVSRSTPTVDDNLLIVGIYGPAVVIAVNRLNGRLVWSRQLDPRPRALITMSGTIYLGSFYVGISSLEEALPADKCCTFRGSLVKLDVRTGAISWQTFMLPDNGGKLGAPPEVLKCQEEQNNQTTKPDHPDQCIGPEAPMLLTIYANGTIRDVVVAVQKSGFAWALNRDNDPFGIRNIGKKFTEDAVFLQLAGPGRAEGGGQWGAATDGRRVYTNIANSNRVNFTLAPARQTTTAGAWVALDAYTGEILWSTANPSNETAHAPHGSVAPNGLIYAMDTNAGSILWSYNTGSTVYGGISEVMGVFILEMDIVLASRRGSTLHGLRELHSMLSVLSETLVSMNRLKMSTKK